MTNLEIQVAIVRIVRPQWNWDSNGLGHVPGEEYDDASTKQECPNYPESLGACAEFEKQATMEYWLELAKVAAGPLSFDWQKYRAIGGATPLQRCEAFLRLHGKWQEGGR